MISFEVLHKTQSLCLVTEISFSKANCSKPLFLWKDCLLVKFQCRSTNTIKGIKEPVWVETRLPKVFTLTATTETVTPLPMAQNPNPWAETVSVVVTDCLKCSQRRMFVFVVRFCFKTVTHACELFVGFQVVGITNV